MFYSHDATSKACGRFVGWQAQRLVAEGLLFLLLLCAGASWAQTNGEPKILFLHLKLKGQTVSLVETITRPGTLKRPQDPVADDLQYELLSGTGESLWKAAVPDPSIRHFEYEDPPGSGNLKRKTILLEEAEFTVRVPLVSKARQIEFYKLSPSGAKGEKRSTKISFGTVLLP